MPKRRSRRGESFWRKLIAENADGVLTVEELCRRHDVSVGSFYGWKRKLKERGSPQRSESRQGSLIPVTIVQDQASQSASPRPQRHSIGSPEAAKSSAHPSVTIRLPGGVVVDIFAEPQS